MFLECRDHDRLVIIKKREFVRSKIPYRRSCLIGHKNLNKLKSYRNLMLKIFCCRVLP